MTQHDVTLAPRIERIAKCICGDDPHPALFEQALIVAEKQVLLARVRAAQIAAIERRLGDNKKNDETEGWDGRSSVVGEARESTGAAQMPAPEAEIEFQAMRYAHPSRLERLERRAWRAFSRAINNFIAVKCETT
jgi:hypothetical protein